jgi:hypothetical protein
MSIQTGDRERRRKKRLIRKKGVYLCRNVRMLYVYLSVKERLSFFFLSQGRRDKKEKRVLISSISMGKNRLGKRKIQSNV